MRIHTDCNGVYVNAIKAIDGRDIDGHLYYIHAGSEAIEIKFQNGPVGKEGINGIQNEALLAILSHRLKVLDSRFPCDENKRAVSHIEDALANLELRTAKRIERGVEGLDLT